MLQDKNGDLLIVGDLVLIPCRVIQVEETTPEFYNVTLETVEPMFPGEHKTPIILNAKQVIKPPAVLSSSIIDTVPSRSRLS